MSSSTMMLDDDNVVDIDHECSPPDLSSLTIAITNTTNTDEILNAITRLRILFCDPSLPFVDEFIHKYDGLTKLIHLLKHSNVKVCSEACWCLANISSSGDSTYTNLIVEAGGVDHLLEVLDLFELLDHIDGDIEACDQALWVLSNIAGESSSYRDILLSKNILSKVINIFKGSIPRYMMRNISWVLRNLCYGKKPCVDFNLVSSIIPIFCQLLLHFQDDDEIIERVIQGLGLLSDSQDDDSNKDICRSVIIIQALQKYNVLQTLIKLLSHHNATIQKGSLNCIGNFVVTIPSHQVQMLIQNGLLTQFKTILSNPTNIIIPHFIYSQIVWIVSNIAAGSLAHTNQLIDSGIYKIIQDILPITNPFTKSEVVLSILNAVAHQCPQVVRHLADIGWVHTLTLLLKDDDCKIGTEIFTSILKTIHDFLLFGQLEKAICNAKCKVTGGECLEINMYASIFKNAGGVGVLGQLLAGGKKHSDLDAIERVLRLVFY